MQRSSLDKKAEAELAAREAQRAFKREQLAIQEAAARAIQCHVRGMLARVTKNKLLGAVINGMSLDSEAKQRNRERRHLRDTRREILVIDWAQELRRAAIGADLEAVRKCIAQLPKDGLDAPSEAGMTALHYACVSGVEEVVIELLQAGADPRKRTHSTFTSLTPRVKVRTCANFSKASSETCSERQPVVARISFGSPFAGSFQGWKGIDLGFPDNRTGHFLTNTVERTTVRTAGAVLSPLEHIARCEAKWRSSVLAERQAQHALAEQLPRRQRQGEPPHLHAQLV